MTNQAKSMTKTENFVSFCFGRWLKRVSVFVCCVAALATYRAAQPRLHFVDLILFRRLCGRRQEQKRQNGKRTKISKFAETEENT